MKAQETEILGQVPFYKTQMFFFLSLLFPDLFHLHPSETGKYFFQAFIRIKVGFIYNKDNKLKLE